MQTNEIETATVLKTDRDIAIVRTNKSKACKECGKAQAGICGKQGDGMVFEVQNPVGAHTGDTVQISLEAKSHAAGYFFVFILPVIVLFASSFLGYYISQSTGIKGLDAAAGFTGLLVSLIYAVRKIRIMGRATSLRIKKVFHGNTDCEAGTSLL